MDRLPISGNVPADIAERLSDVSAPQAQFDEHDDEHLRDLVPAVVVGPLQQLLLTLRQIDQVDRIGALNKDISLEWLRRDVLHVRNALELAWRDL